MMIVTASPDAHEYHETEHVLTNAAQAQKVCVYMSIYTLYIRLSYTVILAQFS
jgi:hypothetical protein